MSDTEEFPEMEEGVQEGLFRLRDITRMSGILHEAQLLQLKLWPRILFPVEKHTIEYDGEQRVLTMVLHFTSTPDKKELKKNIKQLETWVQTLLGQEWILNLRSKETPGKGRAKVLWNGHRKTPLQGLARVDAETEMSLRTEFRRYSKLNLSAASVAVEENLGSFEKE